MNPRTDGTIDEPKALSREWIGLAVLALPCLLYSMDLTVLNLAVPSISADLKPSTTAVVSSPSAPPGTTAPSAS